MQVSFRALNDDLEALHASSTERAARWPDALQVWCWCLLHQCPSHADQMTVLPGGQGQEEAREAGAPGC